MSFLLCCSFYSTIPGCFHYSGALIYIHDTCETFIDSFVMLDALECQK